MNVTYPARIIISRGPTSQSENVFVMVDNQGIRDAAALLARQEELARWSLAMTGGYTYTYTPVPEAQAEQEAARIRAELERQHGTKKGAGTAANSPTPEATKAPHTAEDTTKPRARQVEVFVRHAAEGANRARIVDCGELDSMKVDGRKVPLPTVDQDRLYKWLRDRGYEPVSFEWAGPACGGFRLRKATYRAKGA